MHGTQIATRGRVARNLRSQGPSLATAGYIFNLADLFVELIEQTVYIHQTETATVSIHQTETETVYIHQTESKSIDIGIERL